MTALASTCKYGSRVIFEETDGPGWIEVDGRCLVPVLA